MLRICWMPAQSSFTVSGYVLSYTSRPIAQPPSQGCFLPQKSCLLIHFFLLTHYQFKCSVRMFVCLMKRKFHKNLHITLSRLIKRKHSTLTFCVLWFYVSLMGDRWEMSSNVCLPDKENMPKTFAYHFVSLDHRKHSPLTFCLLWSYVMSGEWNRTLLHA